MFVTFKLYNMSILTFSNETSRSRIYLTKHSKTTHNYLSKEPPTQMPDPARPRAKAAADARC